MSKKQNKKQYRSGRIGEFVSVLCDKYNLDPQEVKAVLFSNFPELKDKTKCANCGESMAIYSYSLSVIDSMLVAQMGKMVFDKLNKGVNFTEANKIHIAKEIKNYTLASHQTITSKFGLIAKVKRKDGTHDREAGWLITKRGFDFLAGKPVPARVNVFRNQIQERFEEMTTIHEITQHSVEFRQFKDVPYKELEHYSIAGYAQPNLL